MNLNDHLLTLEQYTLTNEIDFKKSIEQLVAYCQSGDSLNEDAQLREDSLRLAECMARAFNFDSRDTASSLALMRECEQILVHQNTAAILYLLSLAKLKALAQDRECESHYYEAIERARACGDVLWQIIVLVRTGRYNIYVGRYEEALGFCFEAQNLVATRSVHSPIVKAHVEFHIALGLLQIQKAEQSIEHFQRALELYRIAASADFIANTLQTLAGAYESLGRFDDAVATWTEAVELCEVNQFNELAAYVRTNLGSTLLHLARYDEATAQILKAKETLDLSPDLTVRASNVLHIAIAYGEQSNAHRDEALALKYYDEAIALAERSGNKHLLSSVFKNRYDFHWHAERYKEALEDFQRFVQLDHEVFSSDVELKVKAMEQEHERQMVLTEQKVTTALLHRVFPVAVVERMKYNESVADYFENVSVLFADIVNFTPMGSRLSPQDVIGLLNGIFAMFDETMRKHGCEKIKTIGDGYMAVAGAPLSCEDHAERLVLAAVDLSEKLQGLFVHDVLHDHPVAVEEDAELSFRMGIHCGPVVAGVVGQERFVYDLYGDTVNTAARMESHSEPGKVHISSEVFELLKQRNTTRYNDNGSITLSLHRDDNPQLVLIPRGEIRIKGKGEMQTYYVERG